MFFLHIFLLWSIAEIKINIIKNDIRENREISYRDYKYDLDSLFTDTPLFSEPNLTFKIKNLEHNSMWGKVAEMVLNSKRGKVK